MGTGENVGENVGESTGVSGTSLSRPLAPVIGATSSTTSSITVNFSNPNPYSVDSYNIYYYLASALVDSFTIIGTATQHTISSGLSEGTQYSVIMTSIEGERESSDSITSSIFTKISGIFAERRADFESGTLGQVATGSDGFDLAGTQSFYDDTRSSSLSRSCKTTLPAGSNGQATFGGYFNQSPLLPVSVGEKLTYQLDMWIDPAWDWKTGSKGPFRIQLKNSSGSSYGYFDLICDEGGGGSNYIRTEFSVGLLAVFTSLFPTGQWITLKTEIKLSNVVGQGSWKVWYDSDLVYDASVGYRTCFNATDQITGIHCFAFFNEDTPDFDQYMWLDNFIITRSSI